MWRARLIVDVLPNALESPLQCLEGFALIIFSGHLTPASRPISLGQEVIAELHPRHICPGF